jgi:hypothetical protein
MQLLIEPCEFPNNTSPREWLARKNYCADLSARSVFCQSRELVRSRCGKFSPDTNLISKEPALNERRYQYPYRREQSDLKRR